jgi:predicted nuclease with TOPRIM domain
LKESLQSKEAENDELRNELEIAEEKFHKAEERNKTMMNSIMKLQDIVRIFF